MSTRLGAVLGALFLVVLGIAVSGAPAMAAAEESGDAVDSATQMAVLIATVLAFGGAIVMGRRALRAPATLDVLFLDDLAGIDLLEPMPTPGDESKIEQVFEAVFLSMLLLYALFDRGFAWTHVPGTPLFVGELTLLLGLVTLSSKRVRLRAAIRRSPPMVMLVTWMAWGLIFLVAHIPAYGLNAIRDSALWYYGVTAILVLFLLLSDPARFGRWTQLFGRAIPFLLAWFPIAIALDSIFGRRSPFVPDSEIPIFAHRFGNIAVLSAIAIGFIWLVDRERGTFSTAQRIGYTTMGVLGVLLAGFQNRGGMVSAIVGISVMILFLRRRRGELVLVVASVAIFLATVGIVADIRIPVSSGREISAAQMIDNITSVINPDSGGDRQTGTTEWRLDLWTRVVDEVTTEHPLTGFGPGENLGLRFGVTGNEEVPLRNPHNSHVGVLARMGWIGVGLWALLWIAWAFQLVQLHNWLRQRQRTVEAGFAVWLLVSALMILINAVFDPTLEGPQVALWLWVFFGVGAAMPLLYSGIPVSVNLLAPENPRSQENSIGVGDTSDSS